MRRVAWFDLVLAVAFGAALGLAVVAYAGATAPLVPPLPALDCSDAAPGTTCDPATGAGSPSPVLGPAPTAIGPAYPPGAVSDDPTPSPAAAAVPSTPRFTG